MLKCICCEKFMIGDLICAVGILYVYKLSLPVQLESLFTTLNCMCVNLCTMAALRSFSGELAFRKMSGVSLCEIVSPFLDPILSPTL